MGLEIDWKRAVDQAFSGDLFLIRCMKVDYLPGVEAPGNYRIGMIRIAQQRRTLAPAVARSSRPVSSQTSHSTGVAPACSTASADAMNVCAGTITSSPGPMPAARRTSDRADVPDETPTAVKVGGPQRRF